MSVLEDAGLKAYIAFNEPVDIKPLCIYGRSEDGYNLSLYVVGATIVGVEISNNVGEHVQTVGLTPPR